MRYCLMQAFNLLYYLDWLTGQLGLIQERI